MSPTLPGRKIVEIFWPPNTSLTTDLEVSYTVGTVGTGGVTMATVTALLV